MEQVSILSSNEALSSRSGPPQGLYDAILQSAEYSIISTDLNGIITSFNKAAEHLLQYGAEEVIGRVAIDSFHEAAEVAQRAPALPAGSLLEALRPRLLQRNSFDRQEWTYVGKDGRRFPVMVSVSSIWDFDNHQIGYLFIASDITRSKFLEKRHEEIERQLQSLIASVDDIVFELDDEGRYTQVWVRSDSYLFVPREQVYGKTVREVFGKEFAEPFEQRFQSLLKDGGSFTWEYEAPDGTGRWFAAKCARVYEDGKPASRVSVCVQEISERKQMELSLRRSEEKFRRLAENIPGVVYLMKNEEQLPMTYVNAQVESVSGYSAEDFTSGKIRWDDLLDPDDVAYVKTVRARSLEESIGFNLEYRIRHRGGSWRWVSDSGACIRSSEGKATDLIEGYITDITPRKESEEELHRIADESSRIFNNSMTLTALASFEGNFLKLNPAWENTLGWSREELMSNPILWFVHPDDVEKTEAVFAQIRAGRTVTSLENRIRCKDGSYRWILWASSPDIARKVVYGSAIDITSRKKSEEELLLSKRNLEVAASELEEQNHQLDEFAHIISHNLRAPVGNIKALLGFLNDSSSIADYQLMFEKIRNVTHNISETMNELLETIRIKKSYDIERVELRFKDILDRVIQSLQGELIESGATVTFNFNNAPKIYYSKLYLESILQNLLSNAIKYRSPKRIPEIHVSTDIIETGIELRVSDNGLGIDLEKFGKKLFGLNKTFHENKEARGVGLFLTKTQIEALGGNISAESEVDKGTTFIIQF